MKIHLAKRAVAFAGGVEHLKTAIIPSPAGGAALRRVAPLPDHAPDFALKRSARQGLKRIEQALLARLHRYK
jgi:hypothetical protein